MSTPLQQSQAFQAEYAACTTPNEAMLQGCPCSKIVHRAIESRMSMLTSPAEAWPWLALRMRP